jgi:MFS family permease
MRPKLVTPTFALVVASTFAYFLSVGILLPTLPRFIEGAPPGGLGGSDFAVGISVGAFSISAVLLRPLAGRAGDRRGRRPLIVGGAAIVTASVIGYNIATSIPILVVFRLIAGVGEALFFTGAASAVTDLAPEERRGEAVSFFSLALYGGMSVGPFVGESILGHGHFGRVWWLAAVFGFVATLLALMVRDTRPPSGDEPRSSRIIHPAAFLPGTVLACTVWGFAAFGTFVSLYALQLGMSGSRYVFFTYSFTVLLIRLFGARLPDVLGSRRAATIATSTVAAGLGVMALWGTPAGLFAGAFVFGVGQAFAFPALMALALAGAPDSERGAVVGTQTAFVDIAFGLGSVSLGAVAHAVGYRGTFAVSAGVAVIGLVLLRTRVPVAPGPPPGGRHEIGPVV